MILAGVIIGACSIIVAGIVVVKASQRIALQPETLVGL